MFQYILLASHGTEGAIAAEDMALRICTPAGRIDHLVVVPEFWRNMTGDDWLNNGATRDRFRDYLDDTLRQDIDQQCQRVSQKASDRGLTCQHVVLLGEPEKALLRQARTHAYDLIVMGSPRQGGKSGLRSTMLTKKLVHRLETALLIVPHPGQNTLK
ncbi:MAG: universal stress protein [Nitrosomonas sp.]|nr:universal stress protein [Nitrosomonas sp.]MCP5290964.1 universal stress protein [Burkholderiales bacterium]MDR4521550.1 universal stress protein [Nitrosomonas sp.]HQU62769.1 universal stress protein [Nitrosomonas sp.]